MAKDLNSSSGSSGYLREKMSQAIELYGRIERVNKFGKDYVLPLLNLDFMTFIKNLRKTPEQKWLEVSDKSGLSRALENMDHASRIYDNATGIDVILEDIRASMAFKYYYSTKASLVKTEGEWEEVFDRFWNEWNDFCRSECAGKMDFKRWYKERGDENYFPSADGLTAV